jgi:hypothetical protein
MSDTHRTAPAAGRVPVQVPADLEAIYSNFALITYTPSEIVVDFAQVLPQVPLARVRARVVMTPTNAKLLLRALHDHLARFEARFGEISVPEGRTLADHLFRAPSDTTPPGPPAGDPPEPS